MWLNHSGGIVWLTSTSIINFEKTHTIWGIDPLMCSNLAANVMSDQLHRQSAGVYRGKLERSVGSSFALTPIKIYEPEIREALRKIISHLKPYLKSLSRWSGYTERSLPRCSKNVLRSIFFYSLPWCVYIYSSMSISVSGPVTITSVCT